MFPWGDDLPCPPIKNYLENAKTRQNAYFQKEENFFTHHFRSLKSIHFVENNFFCSEQWGKGGGGILDYVPFWGPRASWLDQTGTMHN